MENNRIKCTVDTEKVKLVNKDNFDIVNYIESNIKLQPPDCSLFSEEGFEIPILKEVLYQTKFMREMLKSMDCCCCKVELFFPTLAKEDLEVMVNFLYNGKIICRNRSDLCRVVVNLTQLLGFPNYMDLRSTTNCYALQERTFEKGGNNKVKDVFPIGSNEVCCQNHCLFFFFVKPAGVTHFKPYSICTRRTP